MRRADLIVVIVLVVIAVGLVLAEVNSKVVRLIFGLPLTFILPGYALTAVIFSRANLQILDRIGLSLGLSLAVTALGGLLLTWSPWGLQPVSWAIYLGAISLGASGIALAHRWQNTEPKAEINKSNLKIEPSQVMFGLAILVAIGAVRMAYLEASQQESSRFTQLWLLSTERADTIQVGIHSNEAGVEKYRLEVEAEKQIVFEASSIELEPGASWETTVTLPAELVEVSPVEARIYWLDGPDKTYRQVVLRGVLDESADDE